MPPLYKSTGCEHCGKTGYTGQVGIHEFLRVTPQIREAILRERDYDEIMSIAVQQGFHNMRYDGFKKALRGLTSLEEVVRATATLEDE
ncbi:MAG: proteinral secretion pathway protein [Gallionellaceae bacterium]|nr:MAG: proteinral secretion pathway protein [Gallionellaceae bacterium]